MAAKLQVAALTKYGRIAASSHTRFFNHIPLLAARDIEVTSAPLLSDDYVKQRLAKERIEYMAKGLPVLAADVGVLSTVVRHGETGFIYHDREEFRALALRLANDSDLRRPIGAAGQARVSSRYSSHGWGDTLADVLAKAASASTPARAEAPPAKAQDAVRQAAKKETPLVSVVLPVFNRSNVLPRAVNSVLSQSFADFELIVVDDGSSDDIAASLGPALQHPSLTLLRHGANRGAAAARNTGAKASRGRYVAFIDSDDEWCRDKLDRQLRFMQEKSDRRASCVGYALIDEQGTYFQRRRPSFFTSFDDLLMGCRISPGTTLMLERSLFEAVGPFDEGLGRLEDWDWLLRLAQFGPIYGLRDVLALVHYSGYRHVNKAQIDDAVAKMKAYLQQGRYAIPKGKERVLFSALQYELAAINFRTGHFGEGTRVLASSIRHNPLHRSARLFGTVWNGLGFLSRGRERRRERRLP